MVEERVIPLICKKLYIIVIELTKAQIPLIK